MENKKTLKKEIKYNIVQICLMYNLNNNTQQALKKKYKNEGFKTISDWKRVLKKIID